MALLELPVSMGEALDKLTILDIKIDNIKNEEKLKDCREERSALFAKLQAYVEDYSFWYTALKAVNAEIWRLQDILRESDEFERLAKYVLDLNDIRFRIKKKLNLYSSSALKEQKGYAAKTIFLSHPMSLEDAFEFKAYLYYLSIDYDAVYIVIDEVNQKTIFQENIYCMTLEQIKSLPSSCKIYEKKLSDEIVEELQMCKEILPSLHAKAGFFITHFELKYMLNLQRQLNKLTQPLDELYLGCYSKYADQLRETYKQNPKVKILEIDADEAIWDKRRNRPGYMFKPIEPYFSVVQRFIYQMDKKDTPVDILIYSPEKKKKEVEPILTEEEKQQRKELQEKLDAILERYNIRPVRNNRLCGRAMGLGDIMFNIRSLRLGLLEPPVYMNVNLKCLHAYFKDPANAIEFRIQFQRQLLRDNGLPEDAVQYIISEDAEQDQSFNREALTFTPLQIELPPIPSPLIEKRYVVLHTKCRHTSAFDYEAFKKIIQIFSNEAIFKVPIVLMGERTFPNNFEHKIHGITTVYSELQGLKQNNTVFDRTKEEIFDSLNYEEFKQDLSIMRGALLNIHFGLGGSLCACMNFCQNTITYIPESDQVEFDIERLKEEKIFIYTTPLDFFKGLQALLQ